MLRDVTLGQYYPVESPLHRLDPRMKLSATMLYIVSLFVANNPACYLLAAAALLLAIRISRVPVHHFLKGLRPIFMLLLISMLFNLFLTGGEPVLVHWAIFTITWPGVRQAIYMAVRLILLIMGSALMTYTTTPTSLTDGMEKGLRFLKAFHVPVHEIAMMMSIALRFIPILADEADKIQKAQMARGANFEEGSIVQRAKAMVPLLVPLFISAFRRATDLATAMEARCYHGGAGRTKMHPLHYQSGDRIAYLLLFAYLAFVILLRVIL